MNWYALLLRQGVFVVALLAAALLSDEGKKHRTKKRKRKKAKVRGAEQEALPTR